MKFIVITGGVISGIGKGITSSSIGLLLKSKGMNVTAIKIDPYLNIDAGTMSPAEHGECYVLGDGGEADLDLGNYERFLDLELTKDHNITTGKIYEKVIRKERNGDYLGKTVQVIPHITNEIQDWIERASLIKVDKNNTPDICLIEIGGTVGDIETTPFIEALRQMKYKKKHKFCFVHVCMIINNGEPKTKPTQQSVAQLKMMGIYPDFLVLRTKKMLNNSLKKKINMFCQVPEENIISNIDVPDIYYVPSVFKKQKICEKIGKVFNIKFREKYDLTDYNVVMKHLIKKNKKIRVAIAGKYTKSNDAYLSLLKAIEHASFKVGVLVEIIKLDTRCADEKFFEKLKSCDCIVVPGGFGSNGIQGKIKVAKYARENNVPLLGICLGMQIMVVEYAKYINVDGDSTEWNPKTNHPVIYLLPGQTKKLGGTMRLGNYDTKIRKNTKVYDLYKKDNITERHRHRYEVNNKYISVIEKNGLCFVGKSENGKLMEIVELNNHKYYVGCQFHPEYKSRYNKPHPLFIGLLQAV